MSSKVRSVEINVEYPQVMKMFIRSKIEVAPSATLLEIKELVFKSFWDLFTQMMPPSSLKAHGKKEDVTLKNKDVVIDTEALLQENLKLATTFQATFVKH